MRSWFRLVASSLCILTWSASGASQAVLPSAADKRLPEYPRLRLELPRWSLDQAIVRQPPVLALSMDKLGVGDFMAAMLASLDPAAAESRRSLAPFWADVPPRLEQLSEFRSEKALGHVGPIGAYALYERLSRAEACLEVVGSCDPDRGWRSALDLRVDTGDVLSVPTSYVMRIEWLSTKRSFGGNVSARYFSGVRGEF